MIGLIDKFGLLSFTFVEFLIFEQFANLKCNTVNPLIFFLVCSKTFGSFFLVT